MKEIKKLKAYAAPTLETVVLKSHLHLLAGSEKNSSAQGTLNDYGEPEEI